MKKTALRLPDAALPWEGVSYPSAPTSPATVSALRLLLIGESTVSGVGVQTQQQALAGQLAGLLANARSRPVCWQACGRNGATAADCLSDLLPLLGAQQWDLVVLVLGVNDTTHLTPRWSWRRRIHLLLRYFSGRTQQVLVTAVPPLGHFRALPQPLRGWFGLRAGLLDQDLQRCCDAGQARHVPIGLEFEPAMLAHDGYHPSAAGYRRWAEGILASLDQSGVCSSGSST